jgi:Retinal pigment epithelial membrane protein
MMVVRRPQAWAAGPGRVLGSGRGGEEGRAIVTLLDLTAETGALEGVLAAVRDGLIGVLVLRGEAGIGKAALLEWAAGQAGGMRLARVTGVESEMDLRFAGLHQLLIPFLGGLDGLPGPQAREFGRDATMGEAVFVPSSPATAEDGGYVMAFVYNPERGASDLVILAAQDFTGAPLATVHLPARIPLGLHGSWIPHY